MAGRAALWSGAAAIALLAGAAARAQTASASAGSAAPAVEEVIVTANKRPERLMDVANSVSAITAEEIDRRQLRDLVDLATQVPGFQVQRLNPNTEKLIIRGENSGGSGATVATVIDDVPFTSASTVLEGAVLVPDVDPFDLSRVEVLRGPQGTIYGASAEGGLVKYVTNPPDLDSFSGAVRAGVLGVAHGDVTGYGRGYVNIPIVQDRLALRITGFGEGIPGFIDDPLLNAKAANGGYKEGGRVSLLAKPTDDLTIRLTGFAQQTRVGEDNDVEVGGATFSPTNPPANRFEPYGPYQHNTLFRTSSISRIWFGDADVEWNLHFAKLTSITGYGINKVTAVSDSTEGAAIPAGGYPGYPVGVDNGVLYGLSYFGEPIGSRIDQTQREAKFSQELRLSSDTEIAGHKFEWLVGGFYDHEAGSFLQYYHAYAPGTNGPELFTVPPLPRAPLGGADVPNSYHEWAGFADGVFHFSSMFDIEGGVRYTAAGQYANTIVNGGLLYGFATGSLGAASSSDRATTFAVAPRLHLGPDTLLYVRIASGFRPGGINYYVPGAPADFRAAFGPDRTINYEGGIRSDFFDHHVSLDLTYYYINWTNIQIDALFQSTDGQTYSAIGNAGSASSTGLEWSLSWRPLKGLTLSTVGAYVDAHLTQDAPLLGAKSGDALAYVPKVSNTVNVDYDWTLQGAWRAFAGGGWTFTGTRYTDFGPANGIYATHVQLPSYSTVNLQLGVRDGRYEFEIYARNIADKFGLITYSDTGGFNPKVGFTGLASPIQPRTIGFEATAHF